MYSKTLYYTLWMGAFLLVYSSSFAQQNAIFQYSPRMLYCSTTPETNIGTSDGIIHFEVKNGDATCGDYTYTWSSTNSFEVTITDKPEGNTISNLSSGLYRVTVTDCVGASMIDSIYVNRIIDKKHSRKGRNKTGRKWNKTSLFENLPSFLLRKSEPKSSL